MTAHTGSWIFPTSSPRNAAVPTLCTSRPGLMDTNVCDSLLTEPKLAGTLPFIGRGQGEGGRDQPRSRCSSATTSFPLAWPFVAFMTAPTKTPLTLSSPST